MKTIQPLSALPKIKVLNDPRRMEIVQRLMASPATLSQLGRAMHKTPAWIQHHMRVLETHGLVELAEVRITDGIPEKYYQACAGGYLMQGLILPMSGKPTVVLAGSHDLAVEYLAEHLADHLEILVHAVGSLDGLVNLRMGFSSASGVHLLDANGEYNVPFITRLFPDRIMHLYTLSHRTQGWMTAPGNPLRFHSTADLANPSLRLINRNPGSGTRLWLDREIQKLGIPTASISGYSICARTHTDAARAVRDGQVDVALGLEASALQHGLDFIPVFQERYDLVLPEEHLADYLPLLDLIHSHSFRQKLAALHGYDTAHSGEEVRIH